MNKRTRETPILMVALSELKSRVLHGVETTTKMDPNNPNEVEEYLARGADEEGRGMTESLLNSLEISE